MTSTLFDQHSDTHILVLSALASILLHGLFMMGLTFFSQSSTVKEELPTVTVTLFPFKNSFSAPQNQTEPIQPHTTIQKTVTPPFPSTQSDRVQRPTPPMPATVGSTLLKRPLLLAPTSPVKPILKDTRAAQAMTARNLMKMRVPTSIQHPGSSLATKNRTNVAHRIVPSISRGKHKGTATRSLPASSLMAPSQALTATPPSPTGSTMTRAAILSSSRPVYPRRAREAGWEGTVIVRTFIDTNGVPTQVNIQKSCRHSILDQAAQEAVKSWTFRPAKDGNIPVAQWVDIPIKFDLSR